MFSPRDSFHYAILALISAASIGTTLAPRALWGHWRFERDYRELKQELGLGHYEERNSRGFHHHASLCIGAYGFLMLERFSGVKKTRLDSKRLPYPKASARVGLAPMQPHIPWSIATARFRLGRAIARHLPQCPCCGTPYVRAYKHE